MGYRAPQRLATVVVAATAATTIVLQLVQTRILSFMFWSHVVYLLVYVALLGYGIAGAFGALLPEGRLTEPRVPLFGLLGFALSNLGAVKLVMVLAQARPNTFILGATDGGVLGLVVIILIILILTGRL